MPKTGVIKLTGKDKKYRAGSARDKWWQELKNWNGRHVGDWADSMFTNPPSKPAVGKFKYSGEPPSGWINFFESEQLIVIDGLQHTPDVPARHIAQCHVLTAQQVPENGTRQRRLGLLAVGQQRAIQIRAQQLHQAGSGACVGALHSPRKS